MLEAGGDGPEMTTLLAMARGHEWTVKINHHAWVSVSATGAMSGYATIAQTDASTAAGCSVNGTALMLVMAAAGPTRGQGHGTIQPALCRKHVTQSSPAYRI